MFFVYVFKFEDHSNGGWYGWLNQNNEVITSCKGSPLKGCFYAPRALLAARLSLQNFFERKHTSYEYYFCNTDKNTVNQVKESLAECMCEVTHLKGREAKFPH